MAKKINREIPDAFSRALDESDVWESSINLRELIEDTFFSIEGARKRGAKWEDIASILSAQIGDGVEIKADTLRQYYLDLNKNRDELAKKKRQKSRKKQSDSKSVAKPSPSVSNSANSTGLMDRYKAVLPNSDQDDDDGAYLTRHDRKTTQESRG